MKVVTLVLTLTASGLVLAQPHAGGHHHGHAHMHQRHEGTNVVKRVASPVADSAIAVATVYMLAGKEISANEVQQGIANGTLIWADDGVLSSTNVAAPASSATPSIAQAADPAPAIGTGIKAQADNPSPTAAASTLITSAKAAASSSVDIFAPDPVTSSPAAASSLSSPAASLGGTGIDADFPDGQLDCSDFPDQYGALALNYLGLGGWTGIQSPGDQSSAGFSNIRTVVRSSCSGSNCCQEGQFCSYACPAGYQKSQWPSTQGSTGQSVGGIQCTGGKLYLTNKAMSSKLCMRGNTAVTVTVQNKMSEQASICRTDYPGTEGETIPLDAQPGTTSNLTCPDAAQYYNWQGKSTSAQYYVNPKGVGVEQACQWGDAGSNVGNNAPMNLGVGYSSGSAWLSIFQNSPTTTTKLDFTVEIVGNNGGFDNLSGRCKYSNGQYCSGDDYQTCSSTTGCTVSASSGLVTYVLSD